jgi:hypothetical protein
MGVQRGADPNARGYEEETACFVVRNEKDLLSFLVRVCVCVCACVRACVRVCVRVCVRELHQLHEIKMLHPTQVAHGADLNLTNHHGMTPLFDLLVNRIYWEDPDPTQGSFAEWADMARHMIHRTCRVCVVCVSCVRACVV